jgi:cytochrome c5
MFAMSKSEKQFCPLRALAVLCVSAVNSGVTISHRRDVETPEVTQRKFLWRSFRSSSVSVKRFGWFLLTAYCLLLSVSCRRDMQDQPKSIAYRESRFFKDGLSSRPLIEGTVPRGYLRAESELYLGKKPKTTPPQAPVLTQPTGGQPTAPSIVLPTALASATNPYPDDVDTFPFPITEKVLDRGQERYQIFCSVCHGATGNGDGMIARRGFNKPPPASFHQDRLRQAPVGHFFDVTTNGWGAMPSYASQVPVEDRWAIIAYIRALQESQAPAASPASAPSKVEKK